LAIVSGFRKITNFQPQEIKVSGVTLAGRSSGLSGENGRLFGLLHDPWVDLLECLACQRARKLDTDCCNLESGPHKSAWSAHTEGWLAVRDEVGDTTSL
jgi:hypothetical protein